MNKNCIFCKIASGEIESEKVMETKDLIAINDIKPSAEVHILIIPKKHIPTFQDINESDSELISSMIKIARKLIKDKKIGGGYKIIFNGGKYQFVPHLHMHLLGGKMKGEELV